MRFIIGPMIKTGHEIRKTDKKIFPETSGKKFSPERMF